MTAASIAALIATSISFAKAEVPDAVAARGETVAMVVHAVGAQIYECVRDAKGHYVWQFREPIAALLVDGKTIGRHFAGPSWELADGGAVTAKVVARAPGAAPSDIPLLKLEVTSRRAAGRLSTVTGIQRLNTKGGTLEGACPSPGVLIGVPYTADYTFLRRVD
jgi:hypothetical protein